MRGRWTHKILIITILFGIGEASTALGNHLESSSTSPESRQTQHSQDSQDAVAIKYTSPRASSSSMPQTTQPAQNENLLIPQTSEHPIQRAELQTKYAWRLVLKGRYKAAVSAYQQAIKKNPKSAPSYVGLGISLTKLGNTDTARKSFLKALNLDPLLPSALVHLGYLYTQGHFGQKETKIGLRLFHQASKLGDPFADIALLDMKSRSKL